jgi:hypothetical protein
VAQVGAHLAPAEPPHQRDARFVRGEDLANQLVRAFLCSRVGKGREELSADAGPPRLAFDIPLLHGVREATL